MSRYPSRQDWHYDPMLPLETLFQLIEEPTPDACNLEWLFERKDRVVRERGHECS